MYPWQISMRFGHCAERSESRMRAFGTLQSNSEGFGLYAPPPCQSLKTDSVKKGNMVIDKGTLVGKGQHSSHQQSQWLEVMAISPKRGPQHTTVVKPHGPPGLQPLSVPEFSPNLPFPGLLSPGSPPWTLLCSHPSHSITLSQYYWLCSIQQGVSMLDHVITGDLCLHLPTPLQEDRDMCVCDCIPRACSRAWHTGSLIWMHACIHERIDDLGTVLE